MSNDTTLQINPYDNNIYDLIYISLDGKINIVKRELWIQSNKFDAVGTNVSQISQEIIVSKITQLNTGEFLFISQNCNIYKIDSDLKNPTLVSSSKFTGLTQLSNYQILLTSKNGKLF